MDIKTACSSTALCTHADCKNPIVCTLLQDPLQRSQWACSHTAVVSSCPQSPVKQVEVTCQRWSSPPCSLGHGPGNTVNSTLPAHVLEDSPAAAQPQNIPLAKNKLPLPAGQLAVRLLQAAPIQPHQLDPNSLRSGLATPRGLPCP